MNLRVSALPGWLPAVLALFAPAGGPAAESGPARLADFPVIFYSVDGLSRERMETARALGATVIHSYRLGQSADARELAWERRYLDLARQCGLRVMVNLNGGHWLEDVGGREHLRALVRHLKDHPALAFWYLYDEPDGRHTPEQVRPLYELLKQETPDVPVAVCSAWTAHWAAYTPVLDLTMTDIYPVYDEPFPEARLQHVTEFTRRAVLQGKPVIPVLQAINWKCFAPPGGREYRGHEVARLRYPEAREIRYWIYGGVAQGGVVGVAFWSYHHSVEVNPRWMRETLPPLLRELKEFVRLTAPVDRPRVFPAPAEARLYLAGWKRRSGSWLVLVNAAPEARDLDYRFREDFPAGALVPWGDTRAVSATLARNHLRVRARPWEVFIWKVAPAAAAAP
jgi:hypothetical protein